MKHTRKENQQNNVAEQRTSATTPSASPVAQKDDGSSPIGIGPRRLHVFFSGTVQGIGFRYTALSIAEKFAISGWVRNCSDGRVELVSEDDLAEILAARVKIVARHEGTLRAELIYSAQNSKPAVQDWISEPAATIHACIDARR